MATVRITQEIRDPTKKEVKVISEVDDQAKMLLMKARMLNGV